MAADASAGRFRLAAPATVSILGIAAVGLTVTMFAACGVLLLLTRDYQRAVYGAGGCVAALVCLAVGFLVARRQPASPIGWLLLGWALLTPLVGVALLYAVLDYRLHRGTLPFGPVAVMAESGEFCIAVLAPGAARGGPAVQPGPLQRGPDPGRVRDPAAGRRGPGHGPRRTRRRRARRLRARPPVHLDQAAMTAAARRGASVARPGGR